MKKEKAILSEEQKDKSEATWDWFINNLAHAINLLRLYLPHMDVQQRTHNWEGSAGKRCTDDVHPYGLRGTMCREEAAQLAQERGQQHRPGWVCLYRVPWRKAF